MTTTEVPDKADENAGIVARLTRIFARGRKGPGGRFQTSADLLDRYVADMPSLQTAVDSVPGWVGAMPPHTGLKAGKTPLYADTRIARLLRENYNVAGKEVLELGPLEGFHTYMLHRAGAASIDAIEANVLAFHRCLVTKEVLELPNAHFYLGDFLKWLEQSDKHYDLIVASGVLYHSHDPVRLLELIARKSDAFFLWTHYFDDAAMPQGDPRRTPFSEAIEHKDASGVRMRLHERSYYKAWEDQSFCGGLQDRHFWIDRGDILGFIKADGFDRIEIADEQPAHVNGPSFSIFAEKTAVPASQRAQPVTPSASEWPSSLPIEPVPAGGPGGRRNQRGKPGSRDGRADPAPRPAAAHAPIRQPASGRESVLIEPKRRLRRSELQPNTPVGPKPRRSEKDAAGRSKTVNRQRKAASPEDGTC